MTQREMNLRLLAVKDKDTDDAGPPSKRSKDSLSSDSGRSSGDDFDPGSSVPTVESPREILDRISRHCSCTVCLDIPRVHLYQCKNGHLMCATCLGHLLADARLKDEVSSCPNCRCDISWDRCVRNLAAEKAVGELPTQCLYCSEYINRCDIENHERNLCQKRETTCTYSWAGCTWTGSVADSHRHQDDCQFATMEVKQVTDALGRTMEQNRHQTRIKDNLLGLFSMDRVGYTDFNLRSYRTDDYVPRLFFESSRANNFNESWIVKLSISCNNNSPSNPTLLLNRQISFQLVMKSRPNTSKDIHFMVTKAPGSDFQMDHVTYMHRFTVDTLETPYYTLPLSSPAEVNRLIASRNFYLRVYFFQTYQEERDNRDSSRSSGNNGGNGGWH